MPDTLHPPPSVIASWPKPNYVDPPSRGPALFVLSIVLASLGLILILCRTYSRLFITRAFGLDDAFAILAYGFAVPLSVLIIIGNKVYMSGHHIWDIPYQLYMPHRKNVWWSEVCYVVASGCVKISVLLFYRRLSITFTRLFFWATWIGIIYNIAYMLGFVIWLLVLCMPLNAYWRSFDPLWAATHQGQYTCRSENVSLPLSAALSVVGDLYATLVPLLLIRSMSKTFRQKLALYALFSVGFLVVAAGIVRTVYCYKVLNTDYDFTWMLFDNWIWTEVELYIAILAASAPALKPFLRRFLVEPTTRTLSSAKRASATLVVSKGAYGIHGTYDSNSTGDRRDSDLNPLKTISPSVSKDPFRASEDVVMELDENVAVGNASNLVNEKDQQQQHRNSWISSGFTFVDPETKDLACATTMTTTTVPRSAFSASSSSAASSPVDVEAGFAHFAVPPPPQQPLPPIPEQRRNSAGRCYTPPGYDEHQQQTDRRNSRIMRTSDQRVYEVAEDPIPPGTAISTDEPVWPSSTTTTTTAGRRTSWLDV